MKEAQLGNNIYFYSKNANPKKIAVFSHALSDNHESDLIKNISNSLRNNGIGMVAYDFSFTANKSLPSNTLLSEVGELKHTINKVKEKLCPEKIILIGKSLGGIVSLIYSSKNKIPEISSIFMIGFPFKLGFPPNFQLLREENPVLPNYALEYRKLFKSIKIPIFIIQGDRDDLGGIEECRNFFSNYSNCSFHEVVGANHGFISPENKNITYYDTCGKLIINNI